ncbi:hypothetical protein HNY73_006584 [Argiope bruennichi]|uniref:Uncharacterized protein n=1 Tax=Argiope bruennichi TaxID=94029 RepID=A0A8T0FDT9_ARGBR|nr:hypothetical protein HNY73_006584 [Argiope bruennichi]
MWSRRKMDEVLVKSWCRCLGLRGGGYGFWLWRPRGSRCRSRSLGARKPARHVDMDKELLGQGQPAAAAFAGAGGAGGYGGGYGGGAGGPVQERGCCGAVEAGGFGRELVQVQEQPAAAAGLELAEPAIFGGLGDWRRIWGMRKGRGLLQTRWSRPDMDEDWSRTGGLQELVPGAGGAGGYWTRGWSRSGAGAGWGQADMVVARGGAGAGGRSRAGCRSRWSRVILTRSWRRGRAGAAAAAGSGAGGAGGYGSGYGAGAGDGAAASTLVERRMDQELVRCRARCRTAGAWSWVCRWIGGGYGGGSESPQDRAAAKGLVEQADF